MKVVYLGYDLFYDCLEVIHDEGFEIEKVFSYKTDNVYEFNKDVKSFAVNHNISFTDERITQNDIDWLYSIGCRLMVCAGYIYKIPVDKRMMQVNVHPSLLPIGRGPWPMPVTILKALNTSGVTLHKIAEQFDAGDLILQSSINVNNNETLETITGKLKISAAKLLKEYLGSYEKYWSNAVPQSEGEYWEEPLVSDMTFTAEDDINTIDRILRAFEGYFCYFDIGSKIIQIKNAECVKSEDKNKFVLYGEKKYFAVNDGYVILNKGSILNEFPKNLSI